MDDITERYLNAERKARSSVADREEDLQKADDTRKAIMHHVLPLIAAYCAAEVQPYYYWLTVDGEVTISWSLHNFDETRDHLNLLPDGRLALVSNPTYADYSKPTEVTAFVDIRQLKHDVAEVYSSVIGRYSGIPGSIDDYSAYKAQYWTYEWAIEIRKNFDVASLSNR